MTRFKVALAALAGLLFPLGLALAVYAASAASLAAPAETGTVPTQRIARPSTAPVSATTARAENGETTTSADSPRRDDRRGRCDEPEHRSDPECAGSRSRDDDGGSGRGDDRSGRGSGSDDDSGRSDSSGSGSSRSDDSSGSGGSDSSGSGSGGDD